MAPMDSAELIRFLAGLPTLAVFGGVVGWFAFLYFGFALSAQALRTRILPGLGIGEVIETRPVPAGQIRREVLLSLVSILIFGGYGIVTVWALTHGVVRITTHLEVSTIALDCLLVFFWNELHFYGCHRLLHRPWLMRHVHAVHHRSRVATPFSTYAFHWFEGLLLGSVMFTGMLFHDFHVVAVVLLPLLSIAANTAGHFNYDPFPGVTQRNFLAMTRRHALHHSRGNKNFGFLLSWPDRIFGSEIDPPGAEPRRSKPRLPRLMGPWSKYPVGLVILTVTVVAYALTNRIHLISPTPLAPSPLDRVVPLLPWTAWIYASYPLLFSLVFVLERDLTRLSRFMYAVLGLNLVSELIFVLLPTTLDRTGFVVHPSYAEGGRSLLAWIQHIDTPYNCLPSLHVSAACLAGIVAYKGGYRGGRWFVAWALAISISTLTTKQHLFADVISGAVLAIVSYWIFFTRVEVGSAAPDSPAPDSSTPGSPVDLSSPRPPQEPA